MLRIVTVYFTKDTAIDNEWSTLVDNLIKYKSYSYYIFDSQLIPSVYMPPLYPIFIYLVKITFPLNDFHFTYLIIFIQIILSTYSVYLFYKLNMKFFSESVSLVNSIIFSIFPLNLYASGQISSINLQIFLLLFFLNFVVLITKKQQKKTIFFFSLISGLLILTRGEFILIFSLIIFFILLKKNIKIKNLIKILIIITLVISPYLIRNYIHFNEIVLVKSLGYNLWKGNNELSTVEGHEESFKKAEFKELKVKLDSLKKNKYYEINRDNVFLEHAIGYLKENPTRYINLYVKKFFSYYFIDLNSTYPNYYNFFHIIPIIFISILSLPGIFIFYKKNKIENKCLLLYLLSNLIIFSIFSILPRYKLIIIPIQIILASYFMIYLFKKIRKN